MLAMLRFPLATAMSAIAANGLDRSVFLGIAAPQTSGKLSKKNRDQSQFRLARVPHRVDCTKNVADTIILLESKLPGILGLQLSWYEMADAVVDTRQ